MAPGKFFGTAVFCFIASLLMAYYVPIPVKLSIITLANPLLSVIAIIVGFLATSVTLLLTAPDTKAMNRVRTAVQFRKIVNSHFNSIYTGMVACISSLFVLVYCKDWKMPYAMIAFGVWLCVSLFCLANIFVLVGDLKSIVSFIIPSTKLPQTPSQSKGEDESSTQPA